MSHVCALKANCDRVRRDVSWADARAARRGSCCPADSRGGIVLSAEGRAVHDVVRVRQVLCRISEGDEGMREDARGQQRDDATATRQHPRGARSDGHGRPSRTDRSDGQGRQTA